MRKALLLGVAAGVIGASASASAEEHMLAPNTLACFYECKERNPRIWDEITTLMLANPSSGGSDAFTTDGASAGAIISVFDGNGVLVARTETSLSESDLDEINVCRTLEAAAVRVPEAGLIRIDPAAPAIFASDAVAAPQVVAWVKNLLGTFNKGDDEPFDGNVQGIAKAECQEVQGAPIRRDERTLFDEPIPAVLVEDTEDDMRRRLP